MESILRLLCASLVALAPVIPGRIRDGKEILENIMPNARHHAIHLRSRFLIKTSLLALFISLPATPTRLVYPSVATLAGECDCHKVEALQLELRFAIKLQQAFTGKIAQLRAMKNRESAAMAFADFAKSLSTPVTRRASDKSPKAIDYISRGDTVYPDNQGRVIGEGLCLRSRGAELALRDLESGASCAGIAKAFHAHEDYHQKECSRLTYMVYREKHPADRAAEEAAAYGVQIAALRAEIARVLEKSNVRFEVVYTDRVVGGPPNPFYNARTTDTKSKIQSNRVSVSGDMIKFDGQGEYTMSFGVDGNCIITGVPFTVAARGSIETDGLDAQLRYTIEGTFPAISTKCQAGEEWLTGMSDSIPIKPDSEVTVNLPLRNGAELSLDQANNPKAKIMAQFGFRFSGKETFRLFIECPR